MVWLSRATNVQCVVGDSSFSLPRFHNELTSPQVMWCASVYVTWLVVELVVVLVLRFHGSGPCHALMQCGSSVHGRSTHQSQRQVRERLELVGAKQHEADQAGARWSCGLLAVPTSSGWVARPSTCLRHQCPRQFEAVAVAHAYAPVSVQRDLADRARSSPNTGMNRPPSKTVLCSPPQPLTGLWSSSARGRTRICAPSPALAATCRPCRIPDKGWPVDVLATVRVCGYAAMGEVTSKPGARPISQASKAKQTSVSIFFLRVETL